MKFLIEETENEKYVIRFKWHGYYTGMIYIFSEAPVYKHDIRHAKTYNTFDKAFDALERLIKEHYPDSLKLKKPKPKSEVVMEYAL